MAFFLVYVLALQSSLCVSLLVFGFFFFYCRFLDMKTHFQHPFSLLMFSCLENPFLQSIIDLGPFSLVSLMASILHAYHCYPGGNPILHRH